MDKKEARKILGVTKDTSRIDIERKYAILLKKHRMKEQPAGEDMPDGEADTAKNVQRAPAAEMQNEPQPAAGAQNTSDAREEYSFEQITEAYNVLMGYEVRIKEEPPSKAAPLLKKVGIDEKKARNFFYYYKFHILIAIVVIIATFFTVRGCVTQVKPDFTIAFLGKISYMDAVDKLHDAIKANVPEIKEPGFDGAYIDPEDKSEQQYAMVMKASVLMAAGDVDIFILDKDNYLRYAKNGAFMSLDDIAPKLGVNMEKNRDYVVSVEETDASTGKVISKGPEHLYGIDISNSSVLKESGVLGNEFIAAIYIRGKQTDKSVRLLQFLMK